MKFSSAINEAIGLSMAKDRSVFVIGEGVPDPKGIFGTTLGLRKKFGASRVLDMPVSENALTGVCVGAALRGMRPIITHQRVDFALLAFDQMINNAAKWHYMFGGKLSVPLVVRLIVGRGWGQGAQHSQSLQSLFAHIPGLKVVMPATPYDAKGLLISAVLDNNPVIFIEHRWLHGIEGHVPKGMFRVPIGKAKIVRKGKDVTVVANSHMTIEALWAASLLEKSGIHIEVIDLRTIKPLDEGTIISSVRKTGRLIVADESFQSFGITGEIIARVTEKAFRSLKKPPVRVTLPDVPSPSSPYLTKDFYPGYREIIKATLEILGKPKSYLKTVLRHDRAPAKHHDVPDMSFKGPF